MNTGFRIHRPGFWIGNGFRIQWLCVNKLDDYLCWLWSCPNGNLNRIFNPAAICILNDVIRIEVEYNSLIVAAIWKREICLGVNCLDGLPVAPLIRPWWLYDSERIDCRLKFYGFGWIHATCSQTNSSGFAWIWVRWTRLDSPILESDEIEWIHVNWTQVNLIGFTWIGVRWIRVDSRRLDSGEFGWIHVDWSQKNSGGFT